MSLPQVFQYSNKTVRVEIIDGQPWWVAADVCDVLGLSNVTMALEKLDEDELTLSLIEGIGKGLPVNLVNEPGLYSLILRSRKSEAKQFKRWVTHEVLPAIRKTGSYSLAPAPAPDQFQLPRTFAEALALAATIEAEKEQMAAKIALDAPKVEFANSVANSINATSINNAAKVLGTGEIRLFQFLRDKKILMKGGDHHNRPYQDYLDRGYFRVVESTWRHPSGETMNSQKTLVTGRGLIYIWRKMKEAGENVCESEPVISNESSETLEKPDQRRVN